MSKAKKTFVVYFRQS